jgi:CheY-like chemotaxis protein
MKKHTILWADDDADDLSLMKEILLKHNRNYEIVEVSNGKEALDFLEQSLQTSTLPSLIILDINMPILDGKETLSIIKKIEGYKAIPVVVFTTSNSELDKMFCKKYHVEMITKPPHYKSLEAAVLKLLNFAVEE